MKFQKENFYVITGGPGVGKTTLLTALEINKYQIVHEDARQIIKEQMKNNGDGLPWKNKELYMHLMLEASLNSYKSSLKNNSSAIFFDRGILDTFCYANMIGFRISDEMHHLAMNHRYNNKVFILPPWPEIYLIDNERTQTWEEALLTFTKMKETYLKYGYEVIDVPKDTVENRINFILEKIGLKDAYP